MRWSMLIVPVLAFSVGGCAAVFRSSKERVRIETDPPGADAHRGNAVIGQTPTEIDAPRAGTTNVHITKPGYADHYGIVKKRVNPGWLTVDIVTCVFPIALCIPLLVDAISGAWYDVENRYAVTLKPGDSPAAPGSGTATVDVTPPTPSAEPRTDMSESEKKATARAAYIEGVQLQEKGNHAEALAKFEAAQKLFEAPTHLLHMAQCHVALGKLVEAQEDYEKLVRVPLDKGSPEVFRQAVEEGKRELPGIKQRVPTLRLSLSPAPNTLSSLIIKLNGAQMPNELVGIARPVNPGAYRVQVWAAGYKEANADVEIKEGAQKSVDLKLAR